MGGSFMGESWASHGRVMGESWVLTAEKLGGGGAAAERGAPREPEHFVGVKGRVVDRPLPADLWRVGGRGKG